MGLKIEVIDDRWPPHAAQNQAQSSKRANTTSYTATAPRPTSCPPCSATLKVPIVTTVPTPDYRRDYMGRPVKNATYGFLSRIACACPTT